MAKILQKSQGFAGIYPFLLARVPIE